MDSIFHRVSIRKYQERPVEREKIDRLLRAAFAAPSAANQQPWEFYVVTRRETLDALADSSPYAGCLRGAPLAIVPCCRTDCLLPQFAPIDLSIATEHIWLEADALGLGAVWLGVAPERERMDAVGKILGLPEGLEAFAVVAVGYPAEARSQEDRYRPERIHSID